MIPEERPPVHPTDRETLERDCEMEFFIAGGPGGQHRNKVETGCRLIHRPPGLVVTATERRSQSANRDAAYARMAEKLAERQQVRRPRRATRPTLASRTRRREEKSMRSQVKRGRGRIGRDD
ncbi:MAG: peptide chain release factor-like protein [Acidobacteriota bacterium]